MTRKGYVYLMSNKWNSVICTGITSNLTKRVYEHKQKKIAGFTKQYNATKLVYYELFDSVQDAIARDKQIKAGSRKAKMSLIESKNPKYDDLYRQL